MRRDTLSTVTGWRITDRLTLPFWAVYCRWQKWRLYRQLGDGNSRRGETIFKTAITHPSMYNPVAEARRILEDDRG